MARYATYVLRIECMLPRPELSAEEDETLERALSEAETLVNDSLPENYYCKIDDGKGA